MITTVYIARHSLSLKPVNLINNDDMQIINEKLVLSIEGEKRAIALSKYKELQNIDVVISSNYARAIATAKYVANNNNLDILINENFGERKLGINSLEDVDKDFYERQYNNENYKALNGESQKEVRQRMYNALIDTIKMYKGKNIFIVSHGTSISFLFSKWCKLTLIDPKKKIKEFYLNDKLIFKGNLNAPCLFKLEFNDNNELISIKNIKQANLNL